jgi:hypothetical protein
LAAAYIERYGIERLKKNFQGRDIELGGKLDRYSLQEVALVLYSLGSIESKTYTQMIEIWRERTKIVHPESAPPKGNFLGHDANRKYGKMIKNALRIVRVLKGSGYLHDDIVDVILPRIAERLKKEGLISNYDKEQFEIPSFHEEVKGVTINPDLVLHHPNGDKILVEVANLKDPKRFVGEIVYPAILQKAQQIRASLVFVIGDTKKHGRSLNERIVISDMLGPYSSRIVSYPNDEDAAYRWLKDFIERLFRN